MRREGDKERVIEGEREVRRVGEGERKIGRE
jgi:hypothetical protein